MLNAWQKNVLALFATLIVAGASEILFDVSKREPIFVIAVLIGLAAVFLALSLAFARISPHAVVDWNAFNMRLQRAAVKHQIEGATEVARAAFHDATLSPREVTTIWLHNPFTTYVAECGLTGRILGYADAFPLTPQFAVEFMSGKRSEEDIRPEVVLDETHNSKARYLYIGGVAVHPNAGGPHERSLRAAVLTLGFIGYVRDIFFSEPDREITIFSVAYSPEGERLCESLDLFPRCEVLTFGKLSRLYSRIVKRADLDARLAVLPSFMRQNID